MADRIAQRLFRINDEIAALRGEEARVAEELSFHRHIHDDAQRDAAVSGRYEDRAFARDSASDVARFERALEDLRARTERLEAKRDRLLERLGDL